MSQIKSIIVTKLKQIKMEQTAVEWLVERIQSDKIFNFENVLNQAKEMEKQQIIDAFNNGYLNHRTKGEQYYNETFKNK